jgi:hypothetical protein
MEPKLRLLLDESHGEQNAIYEELVKLLKERCQVTSLKKKPLNLKQLTENNVFMLTNPEKPWGEEEIAKVSKYVEDYGGILVAMTAYSANRGRLNRLLEPFGLTVSEDKVNDKLFERENLEYSPLLDGIDSLAAGTVWFCGSTGITAPDQVEILLKYRDIIMGAKKSLGKGTAYLFSCLNVLGNKQLKQDNNARFFDNLLGSLETLAAENPVQPMTEEEARTEETSVEEVPAGQMYAVNFRDPSPEITGYVKAQRNWDTKSSGKISWSERGLDIAGSSALSAAEEVASMGVLGQIFVRTGLEAARMRKVHVATKDITRVVLIPLPESPQSPNSGLVYIFAVNPEGSQDVHCLCFTEPKETKASWPPLWLLWGWLIKNVAAEKLEIRGEQYEPFKDTQFRDLATEQAGDVGRPDLSSSLKGTLEEQLDMLLDELLPAKTTQNWYRHPQIPEKKLKNAIAKYASEVEPDEVLFLGDTTVFGSAKSGWLLTRRGIHYNAGEKGSASWQEIQRAASAGGFPQFHLELTIKRGDKVENTKIECSGFQEVRPALQELINHMAAFNKKASK